VLLILLALAGCGGGDDGGGPVEPETAAAKKQPPPELKVTLNGWEGAETAGILMAEKRGYFDDEGLNVWVGVPAVPRRPVTYVANRTDDFGVTQEPAVVAAADKGLPIVAVGSLVSRPTAAMIWLAGSGIDSIADLKGKTIGVLGVPFQEEFLASALHGAGLKPGEVEIETVGYDLVPDLLDGKIDAAFGGSANVDGVELEALGAKPVITPVEKLGIPVYEELMVIARTDRVAEDPDSIRGFMAAVARGTADAIEHPDLAAKVVASALEGNPETSRKAAEAQVKATLPLLSKSGYMDPATAEGIAGWMSEEGMVNREVPVDAMLTDEFR
jgi:putative hydroxymethylpyrimidine transport system substrate-binding protein